MANNNNHGGYRPGAGRPATDRKVAISVRISKEANEILSNIHNKSEFIDTLIKDYNRLHQTTSD